MATLSKYKPFETEVWVNADDPDLVPIHIDILDIIQRTYAQYGLTPPSDYPDAKKIPGYGLNIENQVFTREQVPRRLVNLEKKLRSQPKKKTDSFIKRELEIINQYWEVLDKQRDEYKEEIQWLKTMWEYRLFGYWFYCNGTPTYMSGTNWYYLNFWHIDTRLPEYRDRDRRWWMAQAFALLETRTFQDIDPHTQKAINPHTGKPARGGEKVVFRMKELGRRVFFGTNNAKSRRVGDTTKAECESEEYITRTVEAHAGIQGKDDTNASNVFTHHFILPFKKKPIFLKPLFTQLDPKNEQGFTSDDPELGLQSIVDYATTADRSAYDGFKLHRYHRDEPGKVKHEDISKSHSVVKECLREGDNIIGFMKYTTTVDEMNRRGGEKFLLLTQDSHWNMRNENGETLSGMINTYFRGSDGLEGFIDKYGQGVEFDPTPEQAEFIGKDYGAREYLMRRRRAFERKGDFVGLAEEKRKYPIYFRECFTPPPRNVFFRMDILEARITALQMDPEWRVGRLDWEEGKFKRVKWVDDPTGQWKLSKSFKDGETNRYFVDEGIYYPQTPIRYVIGADPFRLEKTESSKMSNGGIAVFHLRDEDQDPGEKPVKDWNTHRFVLTYNYRPESTLEYAEEVLKAAIFTGSMVYPENNIDLIEKKFKEWGYDGYLLYDIDINTGKRREHPGWYTGRNNAHINIFNAIRDYIQFHGHRERHLDFMQECYDIPSRERMTDYDLFTACGGALRAVETMRMQDFREEDMEPDVSGWLPTYRY